MNNIGLVERNIRGAWVVWGSLGIRQYYYYTKAEAVRRYKEEVKNTFIINTK